MYIHTHKQTYKNCIKCFQSNLATKILVQAWPIHASYIIDQFLEADRHGVEF